MTNGLQRYSTTASENVQANTGVNWDEGMAPAAVNNSARQNMADIRAAFDDLIWFQYGSGSKDPAPVYASATSFTQASGSDLSAAYHIGRRVKTVGVGTGTIFGTISVTAYAASTQTVTVVWDSGSLSNEALTIYLGQIPVTGRPSPAGEVHVASFGITAISAALTQVAALSIPAGTWRVSAMSDADHAGAGADEMAVSSTTASSAGSVLGVSHIHYATSTSGFGSGMVLFDLVLGSTTTYYLNVSSNSSFPQVAGNLRAERIF